MSSGRYGLTTGNYRSDLISLTSLGESLTAPRAEQERTAALDRAIRQVPIYSQLLDHFANARLPEPAFLKNTLERDPFDVSADWSQEVAEMFVADARFVGLVRDVGGSLYLIAEDGDAAQPVEPTASPVTTDVKMPTESDSVPAVGDGEAPAPITSSDARNGRVFISHGKSRAIAEQLKDIIKFGKLEPVLAVEEETVSQPVPAKVMDAMRSCFAGIMHVEAEEVVAGEDGLPRHRLNENVLIEIGAALALYTPNFILLVEEGVQLPSNLQGLYECRYSGEKLDGEATMKVLRAFNDFE